MKSLSTSAVTPEEFRSMPETMNRQHLIDGTLIEEPTPTYDHQRFTLNLALRLTAEMKRTGLGVVCAAPLDVWLSDDLVLQPDVFVIRRERMNLIRDGYFRGGPDLAAEILSPATRQFVRNRKRRLYAAHGVGEMWIIDPQSRQVEVYNFHRSSLAPCDVAGDGAVVVSPTLSGVAVTVADIFDQ